jgi:hypothetical protein
MLSVVAEGQLATTPLWVAVATAAASAAAGTWRWFIMPLDTCKTILQVIINYNSRPVHVFKHSIIWASRSVVPISKKLFLRSMCHLIDRWMAL